MELEKKGKCLVGDLAGTWSYDPATGWIELVVNGAVERLRALRGTNREEGGETIALTGRNNAGIGVWAIRENQ